MARQVRGRPPPKHVVQTGPKRSNVEIAQARDLDVKSYFHPAAPGRPSHAAFRSGGAALRLPAAWLSAVRAIDAVDPATVYFPRIEFELQLFAHHADEEAATFPSSSRRSSFRSAIEASG